MDGTAPTAHANAGVTRSDFSGQPERQAYSGPMIRGWKRTARFHPTMNGIQTASQDTLVATQPRSMNLEVWYRLYGEAIYRFILNRVSTPEDAEDLLQSTYLDAWERSAAYRGTAQPTTWLITIALDLLRHDSMRASDTRCIIEPLSGGTATLADMRFPERTVEVRQSFLAFLAFAQSLSAEQQRMLELIFVDNVSYVQAAEVLGVPVGTVRSRLSRLRAKLEKQCERPD